MARKERGKQGRNRVGRGGEQARGREEKIHRKGKKGRDRDGKEGMKMQRKKTEEIHKERNLREKRLKS